MPRDSVLRVALAGDVMLGRLVDQLFPMCNSEPEHDRHGAIIRTRLGLERRVVADHIGLLERPWGDVMPVSHTHARHRFL
jgi:hypothetical protein